MTKVSNKPWFRNGESGPPQYSFEREEYDLANEVAGIYESGKLYRRAEDYENQRVFDLPGKEPKDQLEILAREVRVRIGITQKEIFQIGELLCMSKKICQQQKISFQKWIEKNFDFSYRTANNFMNVFKHCFSQMHLATKLPISILYKVSAPKFPDELRKFLLDNGKYMEITNGRLSKLVEKYEVGGMEAIEEELEQMQTKALIERQIRYNFDQFENALRILNGLFDKMEKGEEGRLPFDMENQVVDQIPEAKQINLKLYDALDEAIKKMYRAKVDAVEILDTFMEEFSAEHLSQEWKEKSESVEVA